MLFVDLSLLLIFLKASFKRAQAPHLHFDDVGTQINLDSVLIQVAQEPVCV
jgi:hypothetical protein